MESVTFNEDCMNVMARYPDKYFDLAVVDPPYGIKEATGKEKSRNTSKNRAQTKLKYVPKTWDNSAPNKEYFKELKRISKNQIIWGANHFIENIPNANSSCWLVWDKDNSGDFADCELAYTSFNTAVRKFMYRWNGMLQQNMKNKEIRIHPTQKPVVLYDWIYKNYLPEGGKVIDTHGGSMSNLIAALKAGNIEMTISELDKDYYNSAKIRVNNYISQFNLFQEPPIVIWNDTHG